MTFVERTTELCAGSALLVFNGIDLLCGALLVVYSLYLGVHHYAPEWLYAPILVVGSVLMITALMSWCGAAHDRCSALLSLSAGLLVLLALLELVLAVVILAQGPVIDKFLRDHQQELQLTDAELRRLEESKFVPAYALLGLFAMEVVRFCCTSEYNRLRQRRKFQYRSLHALRGLEEDLLTVEKEQEISSKYAALRDTYKNKYDANGAPVSTTGSSSSTLYA